MSFKEKTKKYFYPVTLGFNLYLAVIFRLQHLFPERLWPDEALYAWLSERIFQNPLLIFSKEVTQYHPPIFTIILSLGHFFFPSEIACRVVVFLLNIFGIFLIYLLGKKIHSPFVGIMASIFLANNIVYFHASNLILLDGTFTVFYIFFILNLIDISSQSSSQKDIFIAVLAFLLTLMKWYSGILLIPIVTAYYLLGLKAMTIKQRLKKMAVPLTPCLLMTFFFIYAQFQSIITVFKGHHLIFPFLYYFRNFNALLGTPFLLPFFFSGCYMLLKKERAVKIALFSWLISFFLILSCIGEKDARYILPAFPAIFIISGLGINFFLTIIRQSIFKKILPIAIIIGYLIFFVHLYMKNSLYLHKHNLSYTGFSQAGAWIKKNLKKEDILIAGSDRAIRYYSKINYKEFGGQLIPTPVSLSKFEKLTKNPERAIFLEADIWEYTQPSWIYPMTEEKVAHLEKLGFELKVIVYRPYPSGKVWPVIWIFVKHPRL